MKKIKPRNILFVEDFSEYYTETLIAADSSKRKEIIMEVTPIHKFICFHVNKEGDNIETFGTLSDAIDFYNTL